MKHPIPAGASFADQLDTPIAAATTTPGKAAKHSTVVEEVHEELPAQPPEMTRHDAATKGDIMEAKVTVLQRIAAIPAAIAAFGINVFKTIMKAGVTAIIVMVGTVVVIALMTPTAPVNTTVSFSNGRVVEKNFFTNWLWRSDPAKVFVVEEAVHGSGFMGISTPRVTHVISAVRGKEVAVYQGGGKWSTTPPK